MAAIGAVYRAFTKSRRQLKIKNLPRLFSVAPGAHFMAATGELIRLINYVDDITTTLRRIHASLPGVDAEEKKRLAESLRNANDRIKELLTLLEK
jgi:Na+/phosphate symporter